MNTRFVIVGPGRCGLQLARAIRAVGLPLEGVIAPTSKIPPGVPVALPGVPILGAASRIPPAEVIILAVPDTTVGTVAAELVPRLPRTGGVALHTSGRLSAGALGPLTQAGWHIGAFHPLVSFPSGTGPRVELSGVLAALDGDEKAVDEARHLALALGMVPRVVGADIRPLYHAAASVAGNLTHILVAASLDELERIGFTRAEAANALSKLVHPAIDAALHARGLERLTGPLARADAEAIRCHLATLSPRLASAYRAIGRLALTQLESQETTRSQSFREATAALTTNEGHGSVPLMPRDEGS